MQNKKPSFEGKTERQWPVVSGQSPVGERQLPVQNKKPSFEEKTRFHNTGAIKEENNAKVPNDAAAG